MAAATSTAAVTATAMASAVVTAPIAASVTPAMPEKAVGPEIKPTAIMRVGALVVRVTGGRVPIQAQDS